MNFFLALLFAVNIGDPWWTVQESGRDTNLRGVSVAYDKHVGIKKNYFVWASGSNGVILRSKDSGATWQSLKVEGGGDLDFRDVEAVDDRTAYVMSSGEGDKSHIYKTSDGGRTWTLQYSDKRQGFFLDSLACDSATHCVALSDPVAGKFLVLETDDGKHWRELPRDKMPAALTGEGAFAASGTAIALCGPHDIYFGTGGARVARVFHSHDNGRSWTAAEIPIAAGQPSSGVFSVACIDSDEVIAVGGDYKEFGIAGQIAAISKDYGATWSLTAQQPSGFRSAVGRVSSNGYATVGTNGTDFTHDGGIHWIHTEQLNLNAATFRDDVGWGVGPHGVIARFKAH